MGFIVWVLVVASTVWFGLAITTFVCMGSILFKKTTQVRTQESIVTLAEEPST